jgi:hypothetical protein
VAACSLAVMKIAAVAPAAVEVKVPVLPNQLQTVILSVLLKVLHCEICDLTRLKNLALTQKNFRLHVLSHPADFGLSNLPQYLIFHRILTYGMMKKMSMMSNKNFPPHNFSRSSRLSHSRHSTTTTPHDSGRRHNICMRRRNSRKSKMPDTARKIRHNYNRRNNTMKISATMDNYCSCTSRDRNTIRRSGVPAVPTRCASSSTPDGH